MSDIGKIADATTTLLRGHLQAVHEDGVKEGIRLEQERREKVRDRAQRVAQAGAGDPA